MVCGHDDFTLTKYIYQKQEIIQPWRRFKCDFMLLPLILEAQGVNYPKVMTGPNDAYDGKPRARLCVVRRIRASAFSWQPILNLATREPTPTRSVSHGWRSLLRDLQS